MSGRSKNHTLKGGTSLYSLCMGVPPPPGRPSLTLNQLEIKLCRGNETTDYQLCYNSVALNQDCVIGDVSYRITDQTTNVFVIISIKNSCEYDHILSLNLQLNGFSFLTNFDQPIHMFISLKWRLLLTQNAQVTLCLVNFP